MELEIIKREKGTFLTVPDELIASLKSNSDAHLAEEQTKQLTELTDKVAERDATIASMEANWDAILHDPEKFTELTEKMETFAGVAGDDRDLALINLVSRLGGAHLLKTLTPEQAEAEQASMAEESQKDELVELARALEQIK